MSGKGGNSSGGNQAATVRMYANGRYNSLILVQRVGFDVYTEVERGEDDLRLCPCHRGA